MSATKRAAPAASNTTFPRRRPRDDPAGVCGNSEGVHARIIHPRINRRHHPISEPRSSMLTTSPARSARHMSSFVVRASTRTISPFRKIWPDLGSTHETRLPTVGFDATATLIRADFGLGRYVPQVSDEIQLHLTSQGVEAKAYAEYLKAQAAKK